MKMGELRESFPLFSVYCILVGIVRLLQLGLDGFHSVLDHAPMHYDVEFLESGANHHNCHHTFPPFGQV